MLEFIIVWIVFSPAVCVLVGKMIASGNKNDADATKFRNMNNNLLFFTSRLSAWILQGGNLPVCNQSYLPVTSVRKDDARLYCQPRWLSTGLYWARDGESEFERKPPVITRVLFYILSLIIWKGPESSLFSGWNLNPIRVCCYVWSQSDTHQ